MWLFELAEGLKTIADVVYGLARHAPAGPTAAFGDPEEHPGPAVPEPPPPELPDTGWDEFAPQEKTFFA